MQLTIAHVSDTHNQASIMMALATMVADVIVLTGDILDNVGRGRTGRIERHLEVKKQGWWGRKAAKRWAPTIGNRPVVLVGGNHDFVSPTIWLRHYGVEVHEITITCPSVEVKGVRFAGFRQVNWLEGEWVGEEFDLAPHVERALASDPDILVTHSPPAGILDGPHGYGVKALTSALAYTPHRVKAHFFGHAHEDGGKVVEEMGIYFANGAQHCKLHTIEI